MLLTLVACCVTPVLAAAVADPAAVLEQALAGADPASLQVVIEEGLRKDPQRAPDWRLLELWRLGETGQAEAFDRAHAGYRSSAPGVSRLQYADWLKVRSLARRGSPEPAARTVCTLLLDLEPDSPLRPRALEFARELTSRALDGEQRRELALWLGDEKRARLPELQLLPTLHRRLGAVLPLRGHDGPAGRELQAGLQAALEAHGDRQGWELLVRDCESDALLAMQLLQQLAGEVDALVVPGDPAYAAAAAFGSPVPVVFPWYSGDGLGDADSAFYQFNTPARVKLDRLLDLASSGLGLHHLASLVPANRAGKQLADHIENRSRELELELGPTEWYLPGTLDARRQVENLATYAASFPEGDGLLILPQPGDGETLVPQLAAGNPQAWLLGDGAFLEGENPRRLSVFRDRLMVVGDWLPERGLAGFGPFAGRIRAQHGRDPSRNESLGFECGRLLLAAGERAAEKGVAFRQALDALELESAYGGQFRLEGRANRGLETLSWNGYQFIPAGER